MFSFLAPAPPIPPLPADQVDAEYRRQRVRVFLGIFIGYAAFYLVRKNFSLAIPDILKEHPEYDKTQLGTAMTGLAIAYGLSKFLMGTISDRSNPRFFLPLGLLLSCSITAYFGLAHWMYQSLFWMIALQSLNGWVNGMGWPPCGKTMVHWFSVKERGRIVSLWNTAHNVGGALIATFALWGVMIFHHWGAKFTFNAGIAAVLALVAFWFMRDTPQSCGLPPVEQYRNDYPPGYGRASEQPMSTWTILCKHVLNNGYLWAIAIANAFLYFVRFGVEDWIPTYLQTAKGYDFKHSSIAWSCYEWAAVPGTILCGWVSDRVFKCRRALATIVFTALTLVGVMIYGANRHGPLWIDIASLIAVGFFVYGPIMVIGLHALDLAPKKAAGTAAGFTGLFGYVLGSAYAGTGVGWIEKHWGWGGVFSALIGSCVLTILFSALALGHKTESSAQS